MEKIKIKNLADHPKHFKTVCKWIWEQWEKPDGYNMKGIEYRTHHSLYRTKIPMTFIAFFDNKPVGTASLWQNDLKQRQDLSPWLACIYVIPKMRAKGIGKKLQEVLLAKTKKMGYHSIYLTTDHKNYYEKTGWKFLEMVLLKGGKKCRLYEYKFRS
jgi:GNAT superfamily N-acetyltransferase